jgi:hypothetical protein
MIDIETNMLAYNVNSDSFVDDISADIPVFKYFKGDDKERIFQWVVLMYDFHSPTRRTIKEYYLRKAYCANLVGFRVSKDTSQFKESVEKFLIGLDDDVNKLQVAYIASFSSPEYTQLCGFLAMQYQVMMEIVKGQSDDRTSKNLGLITTEITRLTRMLYGSGEMEEIQKARKALYAQAGEDLKKLRPEAIVEMLEKEGKLPDEWSPYGNYTPGPLKFIGEDTSIEENNE